MKKNQLFLVIAAFVFVLSSCEKDDPIGIWGDIIKLSSNSAEMKASTDSVSFSTEGTWWWVTDIVVGDSTYYRFENIDLEGYNYSIQVGDVVVERRDTTTLFIKAGANTTGAVRKISVGLEAGDYFDRVHIQQKTE
ncbi:hypothetical protein INQ51_01255 [Maribellus sp. CM-23]|uniref:hypothetical protein n=1 Tax=Maribellus sp. CM-23 TaxID=2781026 RepID=UPI001F1A5C4F|nr:hypothetical protein [Maribellus sp. CM-23]MCE4562924.1 hypothetical protein [Maribellus sp. CM-23]